MFSKIAIVVFLFKLEILVCGHKIKAGNENYLKFGTADFPLYYNYSKIAYQICVDTILMYRDYCSTNHNVKFNTIVRNLLTAGA